MRKRIATFLIAILITYSLATIVFVQLLNQVQSTIAAENKYATMLELPPESFDLSAPGWNLVGLWQDYLRGRELLGKLAGYQREVEAITAEFSKGYAELKDYMSQYQQPELLAEATLPPESEIEFKQKRKLDEYFLTRYGRLRLKVKEINLAGKQQITWKYDLDRELMVMNTLEKLGQLFILPLRGTTLTAAEKSFRQSNNIGGAILMGENVKTDSQVKQLVTQLQNPLYPVFIATDQEGGPVKRVGWDSTLGQRELAKKQLPDVCSQYQSRDNLLSSLGINVNFGLVADVTNDRKSFLYSRVFGDNYSLVGEYIKEAVKCSAKTITVVKHFPGHGRVSADTHKGPASFSLDLATWQSSDLVPFKAAIEYGVDWVMLAHIDLKELTSGKPASLSVEANRYIRETLAFTGVIVTDDLGMLAQGKARNSEADLKAALLAGSEQLLYVQEPLSRSRLIVIASELVNRGELSKVELDRRVRLILIEKQKLLMAKV